MGLTEEERLERDRGLLKSALEKAIKNKPKEVSSALINSVPSFSFGEPEKEEILGELGWHKAGMYGERYEYSAPSNEEPASKISAPYQRPKVIHVTTYGQMPKPDKFSTKKNTDGQIPGKGDDGRHLADED